MKKILESVLFTAVILFIAACTAPLGGDVGSPSSPVNLGAYPVSATDSTVGITVSASSGSYYKVTGISPGGTYNVNLTNTTANVFLYVYDDNTWQIGSVLCSAGGLAAGDRSCSTNISTPTGTSLYIQVINADSANGSFKISVN